CVDPDGSRDQLVHRARTSGADREVIRAIARGRRGR
ncbi:MAG: DUF2795 domain-containing protein, partial [Gammaproteobacteria bacterium]|nr:DUF2795 domain-containing protein [Gammaproteobacteria bacterium]